MWFVRSRWPAWLLLALLGAWVALWLLAEVGIPVLADAGDGRVPLGILLAALVSSLAMVPLSRGAPADELRSRRPVGRLELVTAMVPVLVAGAVLVVGVLLDRDVLVAGSRNMLGCYGVALLVRRVLGTTLAAAAPVGYAILVLAFCHPQAPTWWTWPVAGATSRPAAAIAMLLLVLGLAVGTGRRALARDIKSDRV